MELDREVLRQVRDDMNEALAEVGKRHGLLIQCGGGGTFNSAAATLKVEVVVPASNMNGGEHAKAVADWNSLCTRFGFEREWLGKTFTYGVERWVVLGLRPTRHKHPVLAKNSRGSVKVLPASSLLTAKAMGQFGSAPAAKPKGEFVFELDGYTMYPERNKVTKTRHGIRSVCMVYRGDKRVAKLDDIPERIVAPVEVADDAERKLLLAAARKAAKAGKFDPLGEKVPSESTLLSQYLRYITMAADEAWVEATK